MGTAVPVRADYDAAQLRALAKRSGEMPIRPGAFWRWP
jgi:hypothetical protein